MWEGALAPADYLKPETWDSIRHRRGAFFFFSSSLSLYCFFSFCRHPPSSTSSTFRFYCRYLSLPFSLCAFKQTHFAGGFNTHTRAKRENNIDNKLLPFSSLFFRLLNILNSSLDAIRAAPNSESALISNQIRDENMLLIPYISYLIRFIMQNTLRAITRIRKRNAWGSSRI